MQLAFGSTLPAFLLKLFSFPSFGSPKISRTPDINLYLNNTGCIVAVLSACGYAISIHRGLTSHLDAVPQGRKGSCRASGTKHGRRCRRSLLPQRCKFCGITNWLCTSPMRYIAYLPAGVWSPAGGWWADPKHWRRNTALAFGSVAAFCSATTRIVVDKLICTTQGSICDRDSHIQTLC